MVGQPRLYAAAAVAACLGALALSVASAWSQAPTGGVGVPPAPVTSGSRGAAADPDPDPATAAVPQLAQAAQAPTADQAPPEKTPEHRQELQQQVPLEHLKPNAPSPRPGPAPAPAPAPAPPQATLPALAPVGGLAGALPNTGVEPLALALTGLALVCMSVSFRAAAALRLA
jgi:hypothetical protein